MVIVDLVIVIAFFIHCYRNGKNESRGIEK
jgi:hypothetical protein